MHNINRGQMCCKVWTECLNGCYEGVSEGEGEERKTEVTSMITEMAGTVCSGATMVADNTGDLPIHNLVTPINTFLQCLTYVELQCAGLTVHDDYNGTAAEMIVLKVVRCSLYSLCCQLSCCCSIFARRFLYVATAFAVYLGDVAEL